MCGFPVALSVSQFTFQYGATSTNDVNNYALTGSRIYIPIWSYFYAYETAEYYFGDIFTFQYGATSTIY